MKIKDTERLLASHAALIAALEAAAKRIYSHKEFIGEAIDEARDLRAALGRPL
jgi:hypothetical protein